VNSKQKEKLEERRKRWVEIERQGIWRFAVKKGSFQWGGLMSIIFVVSALWSPNPATNYWIFIPFVVLMSSVAGLPFGLSMWWILHVLHDWAEKKASRS
jgi:hypothetical protein